MERIPRRPVSAWGVIEALLPSHRCTVVMANGYRANAHLDKTLRDAPPHFEVGARVHLEFSTYDLSNPRVIGCE